jgi:tripartite-type tricarboxylate transporter receptor subunit TctC
MTGIRKAAAGAAMIGTLLALAGTASAQAPYPSRPVRIIVPYAPGGGTSVMSRLIGHKLMELWGQNVIVDNRPGGNTIIGSQTLVNASPDGYTLLIVTSTHTINPSVLKTPYDAVRDFAPVSTLSRSPFGLVAHPSVPAKNLRELIALAKSKPGQLDYASSGIGTANHLALELFGMLAGIKMNHIPYKGGGPALVDLIAGQVQLHMTVPVNLIPNIKNGRVRGIAFSSEKRLAAVPEVPTFIEAGLPAFNAKNWNGILAPAGTPGPIIDKLATDVMKVLQMPEVRAKLNAQGQDAWGSKPQEFAALIKSELDTFAKVTKATNIKND